MKTMNGTGAIWQNLTKQNITKNYITYRTSGEVRQLSKRKKKKAMIGLNASFVPRKFCDNKRDSNMDIAVYGNCIESIGKVNEDAIFMRNNYDRSENCG